MLVSLYERQRFAACGLALAWCHASAKPQAARKTWVVFAMEVDGLLVIDKPGGMTSRDVVNRAQGWFPRRTRIGHAGTLDPLATGILVLCVGVATRLIEYVQRMPKVYRAGITLGATSD